MARWLIVAKTVALTALLTTLAWFVAAFWWHQRHVPRVTSPLLAEPTHASPPIPAVRRPVTDAGGGLVIPVAGVRAAQLADTFTQARAEGSRRHDAIDIAAPIGTPVIAAAAGRVEKLFVSKDGGNTVYLRSPDGRRIYYYAHLDHYAPGLAEGMEVRAGAALGGVGSTGNANPAAPHLHFAVWETAPERKWWEEAIALNPYPCLTRSSC